MTQPRWIGAAVVAVLLSASAFIAVVDVPVFDDGANLQDVVRYAQDQGLVEHDYLLGVGFRDRFKFVFNNMDEVDKIEQPTFTYVHIISPHPPFVFDPQGNPTYPPDFWNEQRQYPPDLYQKGYVNQLQNLNRNMLEAIDTIMANSETPPIIIIQGDHGPWLHPENKLFWNLTSIYFPKHKYKLYSKITP